jgi:hypothetical protein
MAKQTFEQLPKVDARFKIPKEDDGYKYVIVEKPGPNDEGSSPMDTLSDMGYEFAGELSRRREAWRIPKDQFGEIERKWQEKSRRMAKTPAPVMVDNAPLQGVEKNSIEEQAPMRPQDFLAARDKDAD